jgi:hypothetical protein
VPAAQLVKQRVDSHRLVVRGRGARTSAAAGVDDVAVAVPFDVGDPVFRDQRADTVEQVSGHFRPGQVEDQLVPLQRRPALAGGEDPVGVRAVELGVGIDHLRLDP